MDTSSKESVFMQSEWSAASSISALPVILQRWVVFAQITLCHNSDVGISIFIVSFQSNMRQKMQKTGDTD